MKITPFLAEADNDGFVIFRLENDDGINAYVWVDDGKVRLTSFYGIVSYFNHTLEPLVAINGSKAVDKAMIDLETMPKDDVRKALEKYEREMEGRMEDKEAWEGYKKWEEESIKMVEEAAKDGGEVMF